MTVQELEDILVKVPNQKLPVKMRRFDEPHPPYVTKVKQKSTHVFLPRSTTWTYVFLFNRPFHFHMTVKKFLKKLSRLDAASTVSTFMYNSAGSWFIYANRVEVQEDAVMIYMDLCQ